jgi:hypothetical protein
VKVYAPGRPGFEAEQEVYRRMGEHPAYSECVYAEDGFLVLRRLHGVTFYDAVHPGLPIPDQYRRGAGLRSPSRPAPARRTWP